MGIGGISVWQLLIVLAIVVLLFGTKRLKGLGGDIGSAIKGFKNAMDDEPKDDKDAAPKSVQQDSEAVKQEQAEAEKVEK